jgi:hypothetical protein
MVSGVWQITHWLVFDDENLARWRRVFIFGTGCATPVIGFDENSIKVLLDPVPKP